MESPRDLILVPPYDETENLKRVVCLHADWHSIDFEIYTMRSSSIEHKLAVLALHAKCFYPSCLL